MSHVSDTPAPPAIPEGFKLLAGGASDLFIGVNGPLYRKRDGERFVLGLRVERRHCNPMPTCHGGMLMTFVDMAMAMGINYQEKLGRFLPTINITTDFLAPAQIGAWLEGRTDVLRMTRTMVFAQCLVTADGVNVVRANGIFKIGAELKRPSDPAGG
jgi:uncharacterized protein (TIGR00369 family)